MFDSATLVGVICCYMGLLFAVVLFVERKSATRIKLVNNPIVYSLSLAVYCTSWTYYGSVGKAVDSPFLFLAIYLGPTLAMIFGWTVLRKLVRIKSIHRVTSIADLISARYDKSQTLAAVATVIALVGVTPYIALQLKSVISTFHLLTTSAGQPETWLGRAVGPILVGLMILFTIIIGVRRMDPTERHPGIVMAVALESVVKLVAFISAGVFVTFVLFDGFVDIFARFAQLPPGVGPSPARSGGSAFFEWMTYLLLAMSAIMFLPRQFHVAVVENFDEKHIKTAMWMFPLYLLLINIFVLPIAMGGVLKGLPYHQADSFVLRLPLSAGQKWLSLFVFIGGFSAAMGMIMISAMTLATMVTNHLMLPIVESAKWLGFMRRHILKGRWLAVAAGILTAYWFEQKVGESYMLVNMGMISFAAIAQFAPVVLGGIFWRRATKTGALLGLSAGSLIWFYTLFVPALVKSGWLPVALIEQGPFGVSWLRPEHLLGLTGLDSLSHCLLWAMLLNVSLFVLGSLMTRPSQNEERLAEEFVSAIQAPGKLKPLERGEAVMDLGQKVRQFEALLSRYFPKSVSAAVIGRSLRSVGVAGQDRISIIELAELQDAVEKTLAGAIGASAARQALNQSGIFSDDETYALSEVYVAVLADLRITPTEMKRKIDFYQEREEILTQSADELSQRVEQREQEIRQRRRIEGMLRASEEKYRVLIEDAPIGIRINQDGRCVYCNPRLLGIFAFDDLHEVVGRPVEGIYVEQDRARVTQYMVELLRGDYVPPSYEARGRTKDGRIVDLSLVLTEVTYEGKPAVLSFIQDVTDRKKAQAEREDLQRQLAQAQKMEAIGTLAGGVAHDFNNILQAISGYVQLMLAGPDQDEAGRRHLTEIDGAVGRAADLVNGLLTFSRKVDRALGPVDLNAEVVQTVRILERTIPKMITIQTRLEPDLVEIKGDPNQLEQVIMNLGANAKDAMPDGGKLCIETRTVKLDVRSSRGFVDLDPGVYALLRVSDTGAGMDPETCKHIFEPFFTTKGVGEGTGLGLSTVYGIVMGHGGHITCDSRAAEGTTFDIYLPASTGEAEARKDGQEPEAEIIGGHETVLVVDDDQPVLDIALEMLSAYGYRTLTATSGEEALKIFAASDTGIDLVILDLNMPGMGGHNCLKELVRLDPGVKVIVSSGYSAGAHMKEIYMSGAMGFVGKPYRLEDMVRKVREVLD